MDFLFTFSETYRKKHAYERGVKIQIGKSLFWLLYSCLSVLDAVASMFQ